MARSIVVRIADLYDYDWNAFVRSHPSVYEDIVQYYGATVHVVIDLRSTAQGLLSVRDGPRPDGYIELRPMRESAAKLASDLSAIFNRIGKPYCHATVSVVIVRDKISHSFGGPP